MLRLNRFSRSVSSRVNAVINTKAFVPTRFPIYTVPLQLVSWHAARSPKSSDHIVNG
jgi:hypothetical protein